MYITGSVSAHGAVKPLATQVIFIPNYPTHPPTPPPHSSLQLYVTLTLKVLFFFCFFIGQFQYYMGGDSVNWSQSHNLPI